MTIYNKLISDLTELGCSIIPTETALKRCTTYLRLLDNKEYDYIFADTGDTILRFKIDKRNDYVGFDYNEGGCSCVKYDHASTYLHAHNIKITNKKERNLFNL